MIADGKRIAEVVMAKAVPVASASYIGDGCVIWIDERGLFYAVDSEGRIFIACTPVMALEALLAQRPPTEPPSTLKQRVAEAYVWNAGEEPG